MKVYGQSYREEWVSNRGETVVFRWVSEGDRQLFREGLAYLSPLSVYMRFKTTKRIFSEAELDYLTRVDGEKHFSLVALTEEETVLVGVCRGIELTERPEAVDCGLIVADCLQRTGVGRAMMLRLMEAARERGYKTIVGEMFSANSSMFYLVDSLGAAVDWLVDGADAYFEIDLGVAGGGRTDL